VRSILHQVGSALTYAHRRRVVHRDIKPGNILIDADGNAIVTDFGIAKATASPSQTMTGALVGTPAYDGAMSGAEVSGASDQYALGAVAYEMLTGVPPFSGSTYTVLQAQVERPPIPLRERLTDCPPEVEAAILRMLAKDPADRWPQIADAMAALGAEPLADDDPRRQELTQLTAAAAVASTPAPPARPTAPAPGAPAFAVAGIAILPPPAGLEVGDSFVLAATVRGPNGTRLPPATVTWSAEPPGVLKFDSGGGPAVAIGVGAAELTATCKGACAVLPVEVSPPRADEIVIDPPEHGVRAGDEIHLEAIAATSGAGWSPAVRWQAPTWTATVTGAALLAQAMGLADHRRLDSVRQHRGAGAPGPRRRHPSPIGPRLPWATPSPSPTPVDRWAAPARPDGAVERRREVAVVPPEAGCARCGLARSC
jgi:serine/threonine-protein kinase